MKKKKVILITRPKKQAKLLAKKLAHYETIIEPLLEVKKETNIDTSVVDQCKPLAVLITSSNAVFSLSKLNLEKNILIIAVGKKTGEKIRAAGYKNVVCANSSASDLECLAIKILDIKKGPVLYLSGNKVTLDLAKSLNSKGFDAVRINVYKTTYKTELSKTTIQKIRDKSIDEVLIYSLHTGAIFYHLLLKYNLLEYCFDVKLLCLSKKILNYFAALGFNNLSLNKIQ